MPEGAGQVAMRVSEEPGQDTCWGGAASLASRAQASVLPGGCTPKGWGDRLKVYRDTSNIPSGCPSETGRGGRRHLSFFMGSSTDLSDRATGTECRLGNTAFHALCVLEEDPLGWAWVLSKDTCLSGKS